VAQQASLFSLTARDIMSCDVVLIPHEMTLARAAELLSQARISGAPVVEARGGCVGVLPASDFVH